MSINNDNKFINNDKITDESVMSIDDVDEHENYDDEDDVIKFNIYEHVEEKSLVEPVVLRDKIKSMVYSNNLDESIINDIYVMYKCIYERKLFEEKIKVLDIKLDEMYYVLYNDIININEHGKFDTSRILLDEMVMPIITKLHYDNEDKWEYTVKDYIRANEKKIYHGSILKEINKKIFNHTYTDKTNAHSVIESYVFINKPFIKIHDATQNGIYSASKVIHANTISEYMNGDVIQFNKFFINLPINGYSNSASNNFVAHKMHKFTSSLDFLLSIDKSLPKIDKFIDICENNNIKYIRKLFMFGRQSYDCIPMSFINVQKMLTQFKINVKMLPGDITRKFRKIFKKFAIDKLNIIAYKYVSNEFKLDDIKLNKNKSNELFGEINKSNKVNKLDTILNSINKYNLTPDITSFIKTYYAIYNDDISFNLANKNSINIINSNIMLISKKNTDHISISKFDANNRENTKYYLMNSCTFINNIFYDNCNYNVTYCVHEWFMLMNQMESLNIILADGVCTICNTECVVKFDEGDSYDSEGNVDAIRAEVNYDLKNSNILSDVDDNVKVHIFNIFKQDTTLGKLITNNVYSNFALITDYNTISVNIIILGVSYKSLLVELMLKNILNILKVIPYEQLKVIPNYKLYIFNLIFKTDVIANASWYTSHAKLIADPFNISLIKDSTCIYINDIQYNKYLQGEFTAVNIDSAPINDIHNMHHISNISLSALQKAPRSSGFNKYMNDFTIDTNNIKVQDSINDAGDETIIIAPIFINKTKDSVNDYNSLYIIHDRQFINTLVEENDITVDDIMEMMSNYVKPNYAPVVDEYDHYNINLSYAAVNNKFKDEYNISVQNKTHYDIIDTHKTCKIVIDDSEEADHKQVTIYDKYTNIYTHYDEYLRNYITYSNCIITDNSIEYVHTLIDVARTLNVLSIYNFNSIDITTISCVDKLFNVIVSNKYNDRNKELIKIYDSMIQALNINYIKLYDLMNDIHMIDMYVRQQNKKSANIEEEIPLVDPVLSLTTNEEFQQYNESTDQIGYDA
jgi:hypothetical protein